MVRVKRKVFSRMWFVPLVILLLLDLGTPLFGAPAPAPKSVEELYAELAKLPEAQRQEAILAGARKEGKVVVYGATEEEQENAMKKAFGQLYPGVQVEYFRGTADAVVSKMLMEVRADRWYWDVTSLGPAYNDMKKENALATHHGLVVSGNYPKACLGKDWYSRQILPLVIAYNTKLVKPQDAPKSYADLLDPKWKGKVSIDANPFNLIAAMAKKWGRKKTEEWLDKFINGNQALIRKGHTVQTKLLMVGEFPVASEVYAYMSEHEINKNKAPIDWLIPTDVCQAELPAHAVSKKAPHPYAALLYVRFETSPAGQNTYAKFGRIPVHSEAEAVYPRLKQFASPGLQDRLTYLTAEDDEYFRQANELIDKYIAPRIRGGS